MNKNISPMSYKYFKFVCFKIQYNSKLTAGGKLTLCPTNLWVQEDIITANLWVQVDIITTNLWVQEDTCLLPAWRSRVDSSLIS